MASDDGLLPLFEVPSRFSPDGLALVHGEERWSWADLDRRSSQWAAQLRTSGVGPNQLVAFSLPNGPEFLALAFGIYRVGAVPAPLSSKLSDAEMNAIMGIMDPAVAVGDHPSMRAKAVPVPSHDAPLAAHTPPVASSWKACTSGGSTGRPKVIVDGRPAAFTRDTDFIAIPDAAVVFVPGPLYHNAPFSAAVFALWRGNTVVTMPRFDAAAALALIEKERVEWALLVPTMMHRILHLGDAELDGFDLSSWRTAVHTAAPIAPSTKYAWIARFGADHVWEVYGATEGLVRTWIGGSAWLTRPGSVGRPIGGARIRILDGEGRDLPTGEEGEIYAMPPGGPGTSYRYIGADRRITADGWESVGDVGRCDAEGYLYLADRRVDLIVSGGVNVWPAEVEAAILEHPEVISCAVMGVPDEDLGQHVHAVIEPIGESLTLEGLRAFLRQRLSPDKLPRSLDLSAGPVRDDAGKIRKTSAAVRSLESHHEQ